MEKNFKLKNFLFIIAHPDDEVVGTTTIIKKLLEEKNKVYMEEHYYVMPIMIEKIIKEEIIQNVIKY